MIRRLAKKFKKTKRWLKIILLLIIISGATTGASLVFGYSQSDNSDGLVLDIDFSADNYNAGSRTFTDKSGNGNNAVSANYTSFVPDKYGKSGGAMSFNGSNDYSKIDDVNINNPEALTISAWFRKNGEGSTYECVLHQSSITQLVIAPFG